MQARHGLWEGVGEGCEYPMPPAEQGAVSPLVSGEPPERVPEIRFLAWMASWHGVGYFLGCASAGMHLADHTDPS